MEPVKKLQLVVMYIPMKLCTHFLNENAAGIFHLQNVAGIFHFKMRAYYHKDFKWDMNSTVPY